MHVIKIFPVGNGDTGLIKTEKDQFILFDYRQHPSAGTEDCPAIDLAKALRQELKDSNRTAVDVLALTHGDRDHIEGSTEFFELDHAACYQGGDRVKLKTLWVPAAMILEQFAKDSDPGEVKLWRAEARHRLRHGYGIRVFSKPDKLKVWLAGQGIALADRLHLITDAGQVVPEYSLASDGLEFFCHSPFIKHCDGGEVLRNEASLIFQVRFQVNGQITNYLAVGDSEFSVLDDIVATTKAHGNDHRLDWDLFNIPHHCSYLAVGPDKGGSETDPSAGVKILLEHGQRGAYIVSSSWPIGNDSAAYAQLQPPHVQAKNTYRKYLTQVGGREFLVTMEEPNMIKPQPIVFEIMHAGVRRASALIGAAFLPSVKPPRAG